MNIAIIVLIIASLVSWCHGQDKPSRLLAEPQGGVQNPFGVMLPAMLTHSPEGMELAKQLGAVYFRPLSIFIEQWDGRCAECDLAQKAGLKLVLTVRNNGPLATTPPRNLKVFQRKLGEVLDKYRPALLVVENEENSALFYTGTPQQYAAELKAAREVAHQKGIPCTNGGLVGTLVALLVYYHYLETGQKEKAKDFADRAFTNFKPDLRPKLNSPAVKNQVSKGKALLSAYRTAGIDYVNFHWYFADSQALEEAVAFLKSKTGLPVITNEVGQQTDDPNQTTAVMSKIVELKLPIAVWFGLDGPKARGLINSDGSLRETGEAFQRFIRENFLKQVQPTSRPSESQGKQDGDPQKYEKQGPHKVETLEFPDLKDTKRQDRLVPIKVLYPDGEGPFPLVLVSHRAGGTWDSHLYQAQHLASHGYVVFCLEHVCSNNKRVAYYMSRAGGRMTFMEAIHRTTKDADALLGRPKDVSFAIDQAVVWNESEPRLKSKINTGRIGVMGHSYGAYTTLVVCGAQPIRDHMLPAQDPPTGLLGDLSDPRVTFGFAMSPQPPGGTFFGEDSYKTIGKPLVCLTGPNDDWKTSDGKVMPGEGRIEVFKLLPPGEKYFFWLEGADHLSFADSPRTRQLGKPFRTEATPDTQRISKALLVVSCDYYLKGKKAAGKFLSEAYANSLCGKVVTKAKLMTK